MKTTLIKVKTGPCTPPAHAHIQVRAISARRCRWRRNDLKPLNVTALVLVIVGGLNWGLVGLFSFDLVAALFGQRIRAGAAGLHTDWGFRYMADRAAG